MSRSKKDKYEDCMREFVHSFQAQNLKEKRKFLQALMSKDQSYAKGYAYGLNEALLLLKEIALENEVPLDKLGFESTGLEQILSIVENSKK